MRWMIPVTRIEVATPLELARHDAAAAAQRLADVLCCQTVVYLDERGVLYVRAADSPAPPRADVIHRTKPE